MGAEKQMNQIYRSIAALEHIARNALNNFDPSLLYGSPSAVNIEKLAAKLGLCINQSARPRAGYGQGPIRATPYQQRTSRQ